MKNKKKLYIFVLVLLAFVVVTIISTLFIYQRDKQKYEPKLWLGFFDYRLNFRDVGESLNQCLGKNVFKTGLVYRSNKYFSGWSCDKVHNPKKIYSLNYDPETPHAYFCYEKDGSRLKGIHPNTTFEISKIEDLKKWENTDFRETMCTFFKETLLDLSNKSSFLFHCSAGRDRTGAFAAMLAMITAEQENFADEKMINAIECDYEKTSTLEKHKIGRMKKFMEELQAQGGVSRFIEEKCAISPSLIREASRQFIAK